MENNFDIHKWQANHLKKETLNEELSSDTVALKVKSYLEGALTVIENYKEINQIPSQESIFHDVEVDIEEALLTLGYIE